ncbi:MULTISPECIES: MFS transporter [Halorussus]|uniref:MFS transporter n=1 Tax=Halorussus TaxID=1070314 RepID=UPI000E214646|nr:MULTISPECIES: MFS transporter [Halorussus]NHN61616.1 MFS transporter [Halorussus sp. JP-T4]
MTSSERLTIWRYYLYRISLNNGFFIPVGILYMQHRGLGLDVIGFTQGAFLFAVVAAEIPTGYLGDRIGRRQSLILGNSLVALVMGIYPFADSFPGFVVLYVVWAFGTSFKSGTSEAWLYEMLERRLDESQFARINGRGRSFTLGTSALAAASAGALFAINPVIPFFANAALSALGIPVLLSLPKVKVEDEDEDPFGLQDAVAALHVQVSEPKIRWFVLYVSLFFAVLEIARSYEQPAAVEVGMPVTLIGIMYGVFKLLSAGAASLAGTVEERLGIRTAFVLLVPLVVVAYATVYFLPQMIIVVFFMLRGSRSITGPLRNQYLNDRLESTGRATALSGISMTMSLAGGTAQFLAGEIVTHTGVIDMLMVSGVGIMALAALLWLSTSPIRTPNQSATETEAAMTD